MCQRESTSPELQQLRVWLYIHLTIRNTAASGLFLLVQTKIGFSLPQVTFTIARQLIRPFSISHQS